MSRFKSAFLCVSIFLAALAFRTAVAGEVVEEFDSGNILARYTTNAAGQKSGQHLEYFENGNIKIRTAYRNGKLNGKYEERFNDGKVKIRASYRDGELNGLYQEYDAVDGKVRLSKSVNFRDGKRHGEYREYDAGGLKRQHVFSNGTLLLPKSQRQIDATLAQIAELPIKTEGKNDEYGYAKVLQNVNDRSRHAQREQAVRLLMQYRYLCDVPYEGIALDYSMTVDATAAADICQRLANITHAPTNPGMPETEFRIAQKGCKRSNLASGGDVVGSVHMYMNDSDKSNIDRVGHRRWCLNPKMQKTGFGAFGRYSAMYAFDGSRADVPDYDFIAYPPRGYLPRAYFNSSRAWSVQPNPAKFKIDKDAVKVRVVPARLSLSTSNVSVASQSLSLNYFNISGESFGAGTAIIFRPNGVQATRGSTYAVTIQGITTRDGEDSPLKYLVIIY